MKILILEDNCRKFDTTVDYIKATPVGEVEIDRAMNVAQAKRFHKDTFYDRIIIDMQLPGNITGGVDFLDYLEIQGCEVKRVVNSSSRDTREVLDEHGYEKEELIVNSSMYNCTSQFTKFMEE